MTDELKTSNEWALQLGHTILDLDGWRTNTIFGERFEPCDFDSTLITKYEYFKRKTISTCMITVPADD